MYKRNIMTTKDKIIKKAFLYFLTYDYDRVSLIKIAESISITKGGIYHYFKSKEELFKEVIIFIINMMDNNTLKITKIEMSFNNLVKYLFSFEQLYNQFEESFLDIELSDIKDKDIMQLNFLFLLFSGLKKFPELNENVALIYSNATKIIEEIITEHQKRSIIRKDLNPEILAYQIISIVEGFILISIFNNKLDRKNIGEQMFDNFWKQITMEGK